jgi:SSS family solute:Na+ symporter
VCVFMYDPKNNTLINFALSILAYPFAGMLGVFLAALLTKRGNTTTVVLALIAGILTVVLLQPAVLAGWSTLLLHRPLKLASMWWTPIGTAVSFLVCVSGSSAATAIVGAFPVIQTSGERR